MSYGQAMPAWYRGRAEGGNRNRCPLWDAHVLPVPRERLECSCFQDGCQRLTPLAPYSSVELSFMRGASMNKADVFQHGFTISGPHAVTGRPGVFRVWFMPHTLMAVRAPNQPATLVRIWDAEVLVDAAGEGRILEHRELTPPVAELERADFEAKAIELVRSLGRAA
jgi:hypothetical protein